MKRELPFGFEKIIKETREDALSAVTNEEGIFLSSLYLSGGIPEFPDLLPSMLDRGLVAEDEDGNLSVTEEGMDAVSLYPLLGNGGDGGFYPEAFFPTILSLAASGTIPSGKNHYSRSFASDFFTAIFPSEEKDSIRQRAIISTERLIALSVVIEKGSGLALSLSDSERFMVLSEYERIALMLFPGCEYDKSMMDKASLAVYLITKLRAVPEDRADDYLSLISRIASIELPDKELLFIMSLVRWKDGLIYGSEIPEKGRDVAVSTDFTISYSGAMPGDIYLYASPEKCSTATEWKITKQSAKAAFSLSLSDSDIIKKLSSISSYTIPETLSQRLSAWYASYSSIRAERALLLHTDERNGRIIEALPTMQMHIVSKLAHNIFLMKAETESLWRRALENAGFDMLGPTEGPEMITESGPRIPDVPTPVFNIPVINAERRIPYSPNRRKELLERAVSPLRKILVNSGFIVSDDQHTPDIPMINGLYYQEKLRLIHEGESAKVYLEDLEGNAVAGKPVRTEDPDTITVNGRSIRISKIWKAAALPSSVRDWDEGHADNDSQ